MKRATLKQLRAFSLVARHLSFVQAATVLHLTPSAVSLQIKELEQALGVLLFVRQGRAVTLTPAGQALLVDVHRALAALQDADDTLTRLRGRERERVSIGMVSNAKYFLPRVLADFHAEHRDVELRIAVGNREQLLEKLCRGDIDFAVMGTPPTDLAARAVSFAAQPLAIVAAPSHALSTARSIAASELSGHNFIVREPGSGTRAAMERYFKEARIEPPRVMEMTSNEAIKQAVIARMGLAFLSLHTGGLELRESMLITLDVVGLPLMRSWYVVETAKVELTEAGEALRRHIIEHGRAAIERQFAPSPAAAMAWTGVAECRTGTG